MSSAVALGNYTYQRDVRIQTINEDGKVDGEYRQVVQITFDSNGRKSERVTFAPQNTLERIQMTPSDVSDIEQRLPFVLTTEDVGQYNLTYVGRQKVDEVDCYVFDVAPKVMEKGKRYLKGRIWVDQKDLQIVITSAKNVPDDMRKGHEDLSPPFTTYREQVDGKYWFPVYTKADAELHFSGGGGYMSSDVRIRQIVRYTDYKQFRSTVKLIFQGQDVTNNNGPAPTGKRPTGEWATAAAGSPPAPRLIRGTALNIRRCRLRRTHGLLDPSSWYGRIRREAYRLVHRCARQRSLVAPAVDLRVNGRCGNRHKRPMRSKTQA